MIKNGGYRSATSKKKAIVVVAHAMIGQVIWHVMVTGKPHHEFGADYFTSLQDSERETRRLIARLQALGHTVTLDPAA